MLVRLGTHPQNDLAAAMTRVQATVGYRSLFEREDLVDECAKLTGLDKRGYGLQSCSIRTHQNAMEREVRVQYAV